MLTVVLIVAGSWLAVSLLASLLFCGLVAPERSSADSSTFFTELPSETSAPGADEAA